MSIPRMNYPQYRKARKLTHECCNYCDGNCLLLDDGEECMLSLGYSSTVQSLSISCCDKALNSISRFRWRPKSRRWVLASLRRTVLQKASNRQRSL